MRCAVKFLFVVMETASVNRLVRKKRSVLGKRRKREEGSDAKSLWGNPFPLPEVSERFIPLKQRAPRARTRLVTIEYKHGVIISSRERFLPKPEICMSGVKQVYKLLSMKDWRHVISNYCV